MNYRFVLRSNDAIAEAFDTDDLDLIRRWALVSGIGYEARETDDSEFETYDTLGIPTHKMGTHFDGWVINLNEIAAALRAYEVYSGDEAVLQDIPILEQSMWRRWIDILYRAEDEGTGIVVCRA